MQIGLMRNLRNLAWFAYRHSLFQNPLFNATFQRHFSTSFCRFEAEDSATFFPACHAFDTTDDISGFIDAFRCNAARAILLMHQQWKPPLRLLTMAIQVDPCSRKQSHDCIIIAD